MSREDYPEKEPPVGREHPEFVAAYAHINRDTGESCTVPFPAAVFGIHHEFFGVGKVIGSIEDNPVIEVEDRDDGEPYCIMGYDSWWTHPVPQEILDKMASGELTIDSVASYKTRLDDDLEATESADRDFLEDCDIDPDSL